MKILSIVEVLGAGGAETVLIDVVGGLPEHEHLVWHLSRSNSLPVHDENAQRLARAGAVVRDIDWRSLADPAGRSAELQGFNPDVVLAHWWGNDPWRSWIEAPAVAGQPAFVCVAHDSRSPLAAGFDRYVLVAEVQRGQVRGLTGADVRVIPNAVDLDRFTVGSRAESSDPAKPLVVGTLAGLRPGKVGLNWATTVMDWSVPGANYVIGGDGPLRANLEADVNSEGRVASVEFRGHIPRDSVPRFLSTLDVMCHLTADETVECSPIALIEALAAGVPIVALRRGGVVEIVEDGVNGLLAADTDELGRLLRTLASDRALVRRLAHGARQSSRRFGRDPQLAAYRQLLRELVPTSVAARTDAA